MTISPKPKKIAKKLSEFSKKLQFHISAPRPAAPISRANYSKRGKAGKLNRRDFFVYRKTVAARGLRGVPFTGFRYHLVSGFTCQPDDLTRTAPMKSAISVTTQSMHLPVSFGYAAKKRQSIFFSLSPVSVGA